MSNVFGSDTKLQSDLINVGFPPVADFNSIFESFVDRVEYQFNDLSTINPVSWSWVFAGGTPSASIVQNPLVTYTTDGTYNVSLTATNAYGSGNVIKTGYVVINLTNLNEPVFVPGFTVSPNPAKGSVNLGQLVEGDHIRIYNATGQLLQEVNSLSDRLLLDLQAYPKGILLIQNLNKNTGRLHTARVISQ